MAGIGARRGSLQDDRANGARSHSSPRGRVAFEYVVFVARVENIFFHSKPVLQNLSSAGIRLS